MRAFAMGTGSGLIKIPNLFFSTVCCYYRYQAHLLDKGVASVAAVVELARHFAVLATGGKQREAGSGWEDRKQAGIVARALLQQGPRQDNWPPRCPFELMQ